ncbi:hypothetical protein [Streptomyces solicathayae]|uniref:Uncharacterized protein n=1 Tax=Streptomyces solicathayae TaxID=3081768 RepID=A0ABZ0M4L3_9ACTN|nr:hypothetical protein [Streptomyces sp. HUAS YS2]WOX26722.1 hypothetical protein R2D22_22525 [Streptomyces sp. HUAS YS2]
MLGGAGILLSAAPAQAAEVSYKTECIPPAISGMPPVQGTTKVEITAPAEAKVGDEVEVVWKTVEAASKNPDVLDLDKDTVKPTGVIKVGGAVTATLNMEGPRQNPPIPKNSPMKLPDMKGKLKLEKAGEVTLTPDKYNINVSKPMSTDTKCSPKETVAVGATIKVTDGGGSTTSGGSTSTSGGSSTSGGGTSTSGGGSTSTSGGGSTASGGGSASAGGASGGGGGQTDFTGKEVAVQFTCQSPGPASITSKVTINAKKSGGSYALTVKTAKGVMNSPAPLPAGALKPSMAVKIGGADSGTVKVDGPANSAPLEQGKPVDLPDMTGTYKPGATGKSTLSPGTLTINVSLGGSPIVIPCQVKGSVQASLELDTTAQAGGAAGGGDTAAGGGSGSGGGLAETGAEDEGALRALALVAGTVILLGGAVFTFTPWARLRR